MISIGRVLNFHGIKGEVKVGYSKGKEAQLQSLKHLTIAKKVYKIESLKFHKQFAIIKLEGVNSIDEVMQIKGQNVFCDKEIVQKNLQEDEFLITDLIGMKVFDDKDDFLGEVKDVGEVANVLHVCGEKDFLIPFVKEFVPVVDLAARKMVIKPIEGLIE